MLCGVGRCGAGPLGFDAAREDPSVLCEADARAATRRRIVHRRAGSLRLQRLADPLAA